MNNTLTPEELRDYEAYRKRLAEARSWGNSDFYERATRIGDFCIHVGLTTILPFLPLLYTIFRDLDFDPKDAVLTLTLYILTVGLSARSRFMLFIGIFLAVFFMPIYGEIIAAPNETPPNFQNRFTTLVICAGLMTISNFVNAFRSHIRKGEAGLLR